MFTYKIYCSHAVTVTKKLVTKNWKKKLIYSELILNAKHYTLHATNCNTNPYLRFQMITNNIIQSKLFHKMQNYFI